VRACPTTGGQTWVIMVGDSLMYGSFANFQSLINQSQFIEQWYFDSLNQQSVYYAKIVVDTTTIEYAWGNDSATTGFIDKNQEEFLWSIYPNPANSSLHVEMKKYNEPLMMNIYSIIGELVFSKTISGNHIDLPVDTFKEGIYSIKLISQFGSSQVKRFIVNH